MFAIKNRIGTTISVSQTSAFGGSSAVNIAATAGGDYNLTTTGGGTSDPMQMIDGTGGGNVVLPDPNSALGMKFIVAEVTGNNINVQSPSGSNLMGPLNNTAAVFTCLNNGANNGGQWYVTG